MVRTEAQFKATMNCCALVLLFSFSVAVAMDTRCWSRDTYARAIAVYESVGAFCKVEENSVDNCVVISCKQDCSGYEYGASWNGDHGLICACRNARDIYSELPQDLADDFVPRVGDVLIKQCALYGCMYRSQIYKPGAEIRLRGLCTCKPMEDLTARERQALPDGSLFGWSCV
ncbi:unnamed protein product [Owenia fusiformis]|uniref:Uncharacterized protein n=1 Tax=Owenia fusiformis TaxID=6347 RepID=A0A8J1URD9_OWEFU|nr:unnamed protein product [Owenia fusiformis]